VAESHRCLTNLGLLSLPSALRDVPFRSANVWCGRSARVIPLPASRPRFVPAEGYATDGIPSCWCSAGAAPHYGPS
jgi:hypothetical protein